MIRLMALIALLLAAGAGWASPSVSVNGLFKGKAVLVVDGQTRLVKEGEQFQGVKLIAANSREAVIEINGLRKTLGLNQQIADSFTSAEKTEVKIPRSANGHYQVGGSINGRSLTFMLDTGATVVAMSEVHAKQFGVDTRGGQQGATSTAAGMARAVMVTLPKVSVGAITVHSVPAVVIEGSFPEQILLGNSFLSRVEMSESNGVLTLRSK